MQKLELHKWVLIVTSNSNKVFKNSFFKPPYLNANCFPMSNGTVYQAEKTKLDTSGALTIEVRDIGSHTG